MRFRSIGKGLALPHIRERNGDTFFVKRSIFGGHMKNIAVQGCQLDCPYAQITTSPKTSVKCGGKATYAGDLNISISGYSGQGITGGSGSGTLQPTSRYVKIEEAKVVLEGDKTTIPIQVTGSGGTVPVTVTITNAGQNYVKGE